MEDKKKIVWVNILKFLGILAIYIGHFNKQAGGLYKFVFYYHVPLFFFASGFFDDIHTLSFKDYFKKNIKRLMIPYFIMELVFLIVLICFDGLSLKSILVKLVYIILGMKDKLPANSLWFIPCLFSIKIINYFVIKISKKFKNQHFFPLFISLVLYFVFRYFLFYKIGLSNGPRLPWSIDGICWYYIYFVLGMHFFKFLKLLFIPIKEKNAKGKIVFWSIFLLSFAFTVLCYYNGVNCYKLKILTLIAFCLLLKTITLIIFNCYLAYFLSKIKHVSKWCYDIGGNTLYLCGTEQLIKFFFKGIYHVIFGLPLLFTKPIYVVIYALFLLFLDNYLIIPYLKKIIDFFTEKIGCIMNRIIALFKKKIVNNLYKLLY